MAAPGDGTDGPTANGGEASAASSNGHAGKSGGSGNGTLTNAALATLLRDCAYHVERDQFHPALYQAMAQLHAYTGEHAKMTPSPAPPAGHHARARANKATTNGAAAAGAAGSKQPPGATPAKAKAPAAAHHQRQASSDIDSKPSDESGSGGAGTGSGPGRTREEEDYLKDIKKEFKAIGKQFKKFGVGLTGTPAKPGSAGAGAGSTSADHPDQTMGDDTLDHLKDTARRAHDGNEWCEKHFCMGCGCKNGAAYGATSGPRRRAAPPSAEGSGGGRPESAPATATAADKATAASAPSKLPAKPCFHRPNNPNSNLIANGWIEQQRRSKMRIVWKDILASLVEGRRPGEETTLWIQRQIANAATGKAELEALHQIPMKWLEDVNYLDFYGDHRFSLKIYNVADEFQFRTSDEVSAKNWVATLVRARDASLGRATSGAGPTAQEAKSMNPLDDWGSEGQQQQEQQAPPHTRTASSGTAASGGGGGGSDAGSANAAEVPAAPASGGAPARMSIKELRAIAHGAGINTYGMERADLERIAARIGGTTSPSTTTPAAPQPQPSAPAAPASSNSDAADAAARQQQEAAARAAAVEKSRQEAAVARQAAAAERQRQEQEALRIRREQWARQQEAQARAAAETKQREEAAAAARAAEQQRQWQVQQQAWQQQQAQQQQWQQQQAQQQAWQQAQQQAPPPPPPSGGSGGPQFHQQQPGVQSPVNMKYSKMTVEQTEEAEQASITRIKREILVNWALVPPQYQMLRPINQLIVSIHNSFPPAFGVATHNYFAKWNPITRDSISLNSHPDDDKIKKAVRKVRFFLHPDKLPRDLNAEQSFMCRMLWDVTSDSWEEHLKQKDELDWIK